MVVSWFARLKSCAKAGNHVVTGAARYNRCRSGFIRDAPRGRRSMYASPDNQDRHHQPNRGNLISTLKPPASPALALILP
jgi:hypothetical protein